MTWEVEKGEDKGRHWYPSQQLQPVGMQIFELQQVACISCKMVALLQHKQKRLLQQLMTQGHSSIPLLDATFRKNIEPPP
jgi:hypothetical protein